MTHWRTLVNNSETLTALDLGEHLATVKIAAVEGVQFESEDGKHDRKALVSFEGKDKKLAANVINCTLLAAMFGDEVEAWVGHRVTIGADKVEVR
jgi:hypothetical protein